MNVFSLVGAVGARASAQPPGPTTFAIDTFPTYYTSGWRVPRPGAVPAGSSANVRYRVQGGAWVEGAGTELPDGTPGGAWYEEASSARALDLPAADRDQWRGWIINLQPNTTYDLEITLAPGTGDEQVSTVQVTTWPLPADLPVAQTITLNSSYTSGLTVSDLTAGGSAGAWVAIEPAAGGTTITKSGGNEIVLIDRPFVVFRENSSGDRISVSAGVSDVTHGVLLSETDAGNGNVHDIVLSGFDITEWGVSNTDTPQIGIGTQAQGSSFSASVQIKHISIINNRVGGQRYDSPSWGGEGVHPDGPTYCNLNSVGGPNFIGHNHFGWGSDYDHMANDGIGGHGLSTLSGNGGFGGDWTHIYRNKIEYFWDDAIEMDGRGVICCQENWRDMASPVILSSAAPLALRGCSVTLAAGIVATATQGREAERATSGNRTTFPSEQATMLKPAAVFG